MIETTTISRNSNSKKTTSASFVQPQIPNTSGFGGRGFAAAIPSSLDKEKVKFYTWEEIAQHNTAASAWVYSGNKVYDITSWIPKHPGGSEALLLCAGRDITDLIVTYHPFSDKKATETLQKYHIGYVSSTEFPQYKPDQGFYREVREEVGKYFASTGQDYKSPLPGLWRLAFMFLVAGLCYYLMIQNWLSFQYKIFAAIIYGAFQALPLLHCMHDCSHLALSKSPSMWTLFGRLTMDFFAGASMASWHHQHVVGHHVYTNVAGADPDLPIVKKGDPRRIVSEQSYLSFYRFQHIYLLVLYGVLGIKFRIQDITGTLIDQTNGPIRVNGASKEIPYQILSKTFWFIWRVLVPIYYFNVPHLVFWPLFLIAEFSTGYYLAFNFQVSHVSPGAAFPSMSELTEVTFDDEWAVAQMKTSVEYAHNNFLATFACGALNYQAIHHLLPSVSQYHYPAIAPIVGRVAAKYKVPYFVVPTFWEAFVLHVRHLYQMGVPSHLHMH